MDNEKMVKELYSALLSLKTENDCKILLDDLCTYNEVKQMAERAYAAKLCLQGKIYSQIMAETELSSATISRVSRSVFHGSGGYKKFIKADNADKKN